MSKSENNKINTRYRAYQFALEIIRFCKGLPNQKIYWTINDQLIRSATSIGANLIEAKSSSSKKDFINFYSIALKSSNETLYWLCLLRDSNLDTIDTRLIKILIGEVQQISKMIGKSIVTLKQKNNI